MRRYAIDVHATARTPAATSVVAVGIDGIGDAGSNGSSTIAAARCDPVAIGAGPIGRAGRFV